MCKIYILESNLSQEIKENIKNSGYKIKVKQFNAHIPTYIEDEVNYNWREFSKNNKEIAIDNTAYFFTSYDQSINCDYVYPNKFKYIEAFGRSKEFNKYSVFVAANNLIALSSFVILHTCDNKILFGLKLNRTRVISSFSGYFNKECVIDDNIDIHKYICNFIKDEVNISKNNIEKIIRIGQTFSPNIIDSCNRISNKVYNNNFLVKLNISSKEAIEMFKDNIEFESLLVINDDEKDLIDFTIKSEMNMSIHCIGAIYNYLIYKNKLKYANILVNNLRCKIVDNQTVKKGADNISNVLKRLKIFNWGLVGSKEIKNYSVAPQMWKALFSHINYPVNYFVIGEDDENQLIEKLEDIIASETFIGCNIAMPWKDVAFNKCNYVDKSISSLKTINTLILKDNRLNGYNTDGEGLINAINQNIELKNKNILVMGAGGACQTLPYHLSNHNVKFVYICDIVNDKSQHLKNKYINLYNEKNISIKSITHDEILDIISQVDVLINATPCGMNGFSNEIAFNKSILKLLKKNILIVEMVYNPYLTPLLKLTKENHRICEGINMLVEQAAISFYHGFNVYLSEENKQIMREAAKAALGGI